MSVSRSASVPVLRDVGPLAPDYVPAPPVGAKVRYIRHRPHEVVNHTSNGFVREAIRPHRKSELRRLDRLQTARNIAQYHHPQEVRPDISIEAPLDIFAFALTTAEMNLIYRETGARPEELAAFQALVSGRSVDLDRARSFAAKWNGVIEEEKQKNEIKGIKENEEVKEVEEKEELKPSALHKLPMCEDITLRCAALGNAHKRTCFVLSEINSSTHEVKPAGDQGAPVTPDASEESGAQAVGVLHAASRSGLGCKGAAKAIQDGLRGTEFVAKQKALYRRQSNLVGNAPVAQAYVVPVTDDRVVFSVAGPNHKYHTGLRIKLPRLSHLIRPGHVSKSQERKLRAAYQTFFASVDHYNSAAALSRKPVITQLHMVPLGANVFGFPKDQAARIMAEETLRYAATNPDIHINIQVLAINDAELARLVKAQFGPLGVNPAERTAIASS